MKKVFISYSHKDEKWKDRLVTHLKAFVHQGDIVLWDDRKIDTGQDWYPEIKVEMEKAAVAICLISADYHASKFINQEEIPYLNERRRREGMLLLPILVSPCPWKKVQWLKGIQMFPRDGKSLAEIRGKVNQEKALSEIAEHVYEKIKNPDFQLAVPAVQWAPPEKVDIDRLPKTGEDVFGRVKELTMLDDAWESVETNIISFVAWGGVGKSALINKWVHQMTNDNYRGAEKVYAWSFYSQGTGRIVTSADMFINKALHWFGDSKMADSKSSPWDKGKRLAELIQKQKTLLILDGLEPLQSDYKHDKGQVKDPALSVLLQQLAKSNAGLCSITTREWLKGISKGKESIIQKNLEQISPGAGRSLLRVNSIRGTDAELEQATRDFGCHALAVNLLIAYLQDTDDRHIRNAALIPDLNISEEEGKHPRRVMQAIADRFGPSPESNVLHIMGLFDRPASAKDINWLRTREEVPDLTDKIHWLTDDDWNRIITNLRHFRLIASESHHNRGGLDAHPHVREHFGQQLKETNKESWKIGHSHMYEFLKMSTRRLPETLEEMRPLFLAVSHGCLAGKHEEVFCDVYWKRITRGDEYYVWKQLGAFGADLAALSCFFQRPWSKPASGLIDSTKAAVFAMAGFNLRSLGRLDEATEPMETATKMAENQKNWGNAARGAMTLSEQYLTLGDVDKAVDYARRSDDFIKRSDETLMKAVCRSTLANALHHSGNASGAKELFEVAEGMQKKEQPMYPYLYSFQGFQFCDLLLSQGKYGEVQQRATENLKLEADVWYSLLSIALDKLSLGRAYLLEAVAEGRGRTTDDERRKKGLAKAADFLNQSVNGLRQAGQQHQMHRGLLVRAELYRYLQSWGKAWEDLGEAKEIAERGEMNLYLADCELESARLCLSNGDKEKEACEHYEEAKKRVGKMGYHRRDPEVLLIQAELEIVEGNKKSARETLKKAKKRIDEMGCHRWDVEVERLKELLKKSAKTK